LGNCAKRNRTKPHRPAALFELAVFAAPAIESDIHRAAITLRLTRDAGPDAGQYTAARFRDFVTAFQAMGFALAGRHARPRSHDPVYDGIVDLILHRPVRGPPARHCRFPVFLPSRLANIGNRNSRSKHRYVERDHSGILIGAGVWSKDQQCGVFSGAASANRRMKGYTRANVSTRNPPAMTDWSLEGG
jgi:hypothetical protein